MDKQKELIRLLSFVKITDECWTWQGRSIEKGTPRMQFSDGTKMNARRLSYILRYGDIPHGLTVEQTCGNKLCVNPDHLILSKRGKIKIDPIERFWSKVDKTSHPRGCWLWTGGVFKGERNGYGLFAVGRKLVYAHRFSYIISKGEIPSDLFVCHHCDNRLCVNPDHLFLGTNRDNQEDAIKKGIMGHLKRNPQYKPTDERPINRLDADKVKLIKGCLKYGMSQHFLANHFGMDVTTINKISVGETWKEIEW